MKRNIFRLSLIGSLFFALLAFAQTGAEGTWSFIVMGDSRDNPETFAKLVELVAAEPSNPELMFHTGDIVNRGCNKKAWEQYKKTISLLDGKMAVYEVAGNHETLGDKKAKNFIKYTQPPEGKTYYSVTHKNAGFVVLDSYRPGNAASIGAEQVEWLKSSLAAMKADKKVIFAFVHKPLVTKPTYRHPKPLENADEIKKILSDAGVVAVFMGHEHRFDHTEEGGVHYILTAGAGAPLYGTDPDALFHYCRVTLSQNEANIIIVDVAGAESRKISIPLHTSN